MELYFVFFLDVKVMLKKILLNYIYLDSNYDFFFFNSDRVRVVKMFLFCKKVICLVIYFGYYLILQFILDQIIRKLRNVYNNV